MPALDKEYPLSSNKKNGAIAGKTPTLFLVRHGDTDYNSGLMVLSMKENGARIELTEKVSSCT